MIGLTSIQAYVYFRTHTGRWTKFYRFIVRSLRLFRTLDAVHLALTIHCVYYYLVTNFANFEALVTIVWSFKNMYLQVVTVHVIHLLYSHRIWIGTDPKFHIIPGTVVVLSLALFLIVYHHNQSTGMFLDRWPSLMAMSAATVLNIVITSSLWYLLASSRTGFSYTDCFITRLMCYTVNSGCLTSLEGHLQCAVMPHNFIFFSIQFLTAKLYVNSYIALLNTKYYMQPNADTTDTFELRREPPSPGPRDTLQEKFPLLRKIDAVPPTRPLSVVTSRKSVLVTGEKGSFIDI
ncbi:hypothetical protein P692DRAFT_20840931 [Suillus brevipes Sb2]|nr:hypothetical protein P692DRAFT_20840931 [Suillus brevipes Sb2]